jgi:hypothetical protein
MDNRHGLPEPTRTRGEGNAAGRSTEGADDHVEVGAGDGGRWRLMTPAEPLGRVLGAPVRVEGAVVGHVAGVVGDAGFTRVIGLEVIGRDGTARFLPWAAASHLSGEVSVSSRLVLFEARELQEYARHGAVTRRSLEEVAVLAVSRDGSVYGRDLAAVSPGGSRGTPHE